MRKNANIILNDQKEKVIIEEKNNKISYKDYKNTNVLFDKNDLILIRDNKNLYMELSFNQNKALIYLKDLRKNVELDLKVKKINITKNKIEIDYNIEDDEYYYQIEMED